MKNANDILKESGLTVGDLMKAGAAGKIRHLIWLGQVEVINRVAGRDEKIKLMAEIKIE